MKEENKIAASVTEISETKAVRWRKIFHDTISIRIQDPSRYSDWYEVSHVDSLWKQILPQKWLHPGKSPQCTQCTPSSALEPTPLHCTVASLLGKIPKKTKHRQTPQKNPCLPSPRCLSPLRFLVYSDESPTRLYVSLVAMATEKNGVPHSMRNETHSTSAQAQQAT